MLNQQQQFFEQIKKANNILITFNKDWEGDSVSSALALFLFLKKIGKTAEIVAEKADHSNAFSFLPAYGEIKESIDNLRKFIISLDISNTKVSQIKYKVEKNTLDFIVSPQDGFFTSDDITSKTSGFKYDLIVVLDTHDLESLGKIYDNDTEFFYQMPVINIDHHSSNESFGQVNIIELTSVSTSEILFSLFENYSRDVIDEDIATCLLTGMIAETRSFKTQNVTPIALSVASQLISMGARREEIVNRLYRSRSLNVLKLWGIVLARLSGKESDRLISSLITHNDFIKTETSENDLNEVIDELIINIPQAKVIVLIYETIKDSKITSNALIYATRNIDALSLTKEFSPEGTKTSAKIMLDKTIHEAEKIILNAVHEKMKLLQL
ncbi:MAG: Phosphoesterase RecJ domain protein [Parcubacteria group bacterium GW2011_GWE2_39_37]|nr:MAG: Phosphoesterase RecJ domain protein [Parcubacteria group bacterium GW2011_GWE2_39_37]